MAQAHETHELNAIEDGHIGVFDALQMDGESSLTKSQQSREKRDRAELMQLGKNPVLKVWNLSKILVNSQDDSHIAARIWLGFNCRLHLHRTYHMGGPSDVRRHDDQRATQSG